jgi:hypothetical protein
MVVAEVVVVVVVVGMVVMKCNNIDSTMAVVVAELLKVTLVHRHPHPDSLDDSRL